MKNIIIDVLGKKCPIPVIEAKKVLESLEEEAVVSVHVDNETAVQNLSRLAEQMSAKAETESQGENHFVVKITAQPQDGCESCIITEDNTVVVFESDVMGKGSDELGKILIKGFIYALRELKSLPKTCIFYNSGAKLTAEGSESLEDIKALEEAGVEILTCGTCAGFFGLEDKIMAGTVTNMYTIVEKMDGAAKIMKP